MKHRIAAVISVKRSTSFVNSVETQEKQLAMSVGDLKTEAAPLLPTTSTDPVATKVDAEPSYHALLGIACVACASLCFSFMVTFIKYMTFSFSSMEATFWRSVGVLVFNFVRLFRG